MSKTKSYKQWLVLDWKDGSSRTRKSKPNSGDLATNELLAQLDVTVEVPEIEVPTLAVEIDVPEPQVYQATMDALDDEDLPDWTESANTVIAGNRERVATADEYQRRQRIVNELTTAALADAPGRPPVKQVREYIGERVESIQTDREVPADE